MEIIFATAVGWPFKEVRIAVDFGRRGRGQAAVWCDRLPNDDRERLLKLLIQRISLEYWDGCQGSKPESQADG